MLEIRESQRLLQIWSRNSREGNKKPEILEKLAQYELTLLDWIESAQGMQKIYCNRRKMLAGIPDTIWFCSVLCKQPADRKGHSGVL